MVDLPAAVLVGFFPKRTRQSPDWLGNDTVREICSVSNCISPGPENWVEQWTHNRLGFYDTEMLAQSVIGAQPDRFDLYAYKLYPFYCLAGRSTPIFLPTPPATLPAGYHLLGYDIVTKSGSDFFECSPLSCNYGAQTYPVNQYCLLPNLSDSLTVLAEICQDGTYEPGPYYLFEVYRQRK